MRNQLINRKKPALKKIVSKDISSHEIIHEIESPEKKSDEADTIPKKTLFKMKEEYENILK